MIAHVLTSADGALQVVLSDAGVELAQEEEEGGEGHAQEAPNPILPETKEIIWGGLAFLILLFLLWKFALPGITKAMEARSERIRDDLDEAERAREQAQAAQAEYEAKLADARNEAARIIEEARQQADVVKADLQARAEADIAEQRQRAAEDIRLSRERAIDDLRGQVAQLAIGAAERIVQQSLDRPTSEALVERYISEVGTASTN